ncbi:hypothetical protein AB0M48_12440 [Lentzea sp. NPDC051208]|uniref:hypothetical protein n=1 Tax=Lentzea sp. NPDC051208 TaxID=3154642 RepID=UPI00341C64D3
MLTKASFTALAEGRTLGAVPRELPELVDVDLDNLLDPARYPGAAGPLVDRSCTGF